MIGAEDQGSGGKPGIYLGSILWRKGFIVRIGTESQPPSALVVPFESVAYRRLGEPYRYLDKNYIKVPKKG